MIEEYILHYITFNPILKSHYKIGFQNTRRSSFLITIVLRAAIISIIKKENDLAADLILVAKDFSEWIIIEVELAIKELPHTKFQLGVFTDGEIGCRSI